MDIAQFVDLFLHLDKHLESVVNQYGLWIYVLLFAIIFIETGLVVMPFLPGDSLLFVCGAIAAIGGLSLPWLIGLLVLAAILGDALNFATGARLGVAVWQREHSRWFNRAAFERTHAFYQKHGAITIIVARFLPFIRTFAPFVAGVAAMDYARFARYNVIGAVLWVVSLTVLGYWIGNLPWVRQNFSWVALALIVVPALPAVIEVVRHAVLRGGNRRT